jgi:hypothetical protein
MVKDFNIHDLTDQLAQNPLNLPYPVAAKHYNKWIKDRQTHLSQNGFTYDPSPKPKGVGYNFQHGGHIRQRFYNTFQTSSDEILWIIAWHQNPNNYLTNNNKTNYENIVAAGLKAYFGYWAIIKTGDFGTPISYEYLDSSALYHNIDQLRAEEISSEKKQRASTWVKKDQWDVENYEET